MDKTVHIYQNKGYDIVDIKKSLYHYFDRKFHFNNKKVLLKPNLLKAAAPEAHVTTHPILIEALVQYILDMGGKCVIGDSPAGWGIAHVKHVADVTGMTNICDKYNIAFSYFDATEMRKMIIKTGVVFKEIFVAENYFDCDYVINVPKLKTHSLTVFTLGVKNMLGVVPGLHKKLFHEKGQDPKRFAQAICDLFSVVQPNVTVLDGIIGMHRNGPANGDPIPLGRIFISEQTNALDAVVCRMCGVDPLQVPITRAVHERGIGDIHNIPVQKEYSDHDDAFKSFQLHKIYKLRTNLPVQVFCCLFALFKYKPKINTSACTKCHKCVVICPTGALSRTESYPQLDLDKCVRCFCCCEICPTGAMSVDKNFFAKLVNEYQ
ncbi:MAG: DUF362 domain-containing protein [Candidatus Omnitrophica bacterium]|nr:DUF362 domain-containing protein [Candidatus Omnitrophota bacterium]